MIFLHNNRVPHPPFYFSLPLLLILLPLMLTPNSPSSTSPSLLPDTLAPLTSLDHFPPLRRTAQPLKKPPHLQDYICSAVVSSSTDRFAISTLNCLCGLVHLHHLPLNSSAHSQALLSLRELQSYNTRPLWSTLGVGHGVWNLGLTNQQHLDWDWSSSR